MKKTKQHTDPVNYKLKETDPLEGNSFEVFLEELSDVASAAALNNISIDEAGVTNQKIITTIDDIDGKGKSVSVVCDIELSVDLVGHRGIHMSRCEEVLFAAAGHHHKCLDDFAVEVAKGLQEKQESKSVQVRIEAIYLHAHRTKKSDLESQDRLYLISNVSIDGDEIKVQTGIRAYNMTACPCTRTFTKYSIVPELKQLGYSTEHIQNILDITKTGTHTQRGEVTLLVEKQSDFPTHGTIYGILDDTCHLIYELLKRPDEHDLVIRALEKPQFTEDVVREVAGVAYDRLKTDLPLDTRLVVESNLLDSIHIHDVCAKIDRTLGEIGQELTKVD